MNSIPSRLREICAGFSRQRIVVIGDVMLDQVIEGEARRISPEAPIPVVNVVSEKSAPGGAANVARNLVALGASADLCGVVGDDSHGGLLRRALASLQISGTGLAVEPGRPTTVKTRIIAQRHQVVRLDRETTHPLAPPTRQALDTAWQTVLSGAAAVIVADYAKGVVDQSLLASLIQRAQTLNIPVCLDPKPGRPLDLRGCALLTPNRKEAFELAGLSDDAPSGAPASDKSLLRAVRAIHEKHGLSTLLVTLSEAGILLVQPNDPPCHIPTFARQVSDVTGAGDTVIATFVLARAAGATAVEAAMLANYAAGIVVAKIGTAAVTVDELLGAIASAHTGED